MGKNYDNTTSLVQVVTFDKEKIISDIKRPLKTEDSNVYIRNSEAISIIHKIFKIEGAESFSKYVSSRKPFGLDTTFTKTTDFSLSNEKMSNPIKCYSKGLIVGYVEYNKIKMNLNLINKWKAYTSRANNIGTELNDDNLNVFVGEPGTVCTESYLVLGINLDLDKKSCMNICTYFKTKFSRFLHAMGKSSQDATAKTYIFVPLQDFSSKSDIDWGKSIPKIGTVV